MHKATSVLLGLALAAIVYGLAMTGARNALATELTSVQSVLYSTQSELHSANLNLFSTQSELNSAKQALSSTRQTLASTQNQLDSTNQKLSSAQNELGSTKDRLSSTQNQLSSANQNLSSAQSELGATKVKLDTIDTKLKLFEDTMGIKIYSGVQPTAKGAGPIVLVNNSAAKDHSWDQLMSFLRADPTDDKLWTEDIFVSGDFAKTVHNNAEAAGIRAAVVGVFFDGQTVGHGLNAFKTIDKGLVYVDCTGPTLQQSVEELLYRLYGGGVIEHDKIAYMVKGKEFGAISIDRHPSPEYSFYEQTGKSAGSGWETLGIVQRIEIWW